jgi:hypothetical protein
MIARQPKNLNSAMGPPLVSSPSPEALAGLVDSWHRLDADEIAEVTDLLLSMCPAACSIAPRENSRYVCMVCMYVGDLSYCILCMYILCILFRVYIYVYVCMGCDYKNNYVCMYVYSKQPIQLQIQLESIDGRTFRKLQNFMKNAFLENPKRGTDPEPEAIEIDDVDNGVDGGQFVEEFKRRRGNDE